MTQTVIILILIILILAVLIFFLLRGLIKTQKKQEDLIRQIECQKESINALSGYVEELNKIKKQSSDATQGVNNAEDDKSINDVISNVIANNNKRVQNSAKK